MKIPIRTESGKLIGNAIEIKPKYQTWSEQVRTLGCIAGCSDTAQNFFHSKLNLKWNNFLDKKEPLNVGDKIAVSLWRTNILVITSVDFSEELRGYVYDFEVLQTYNFRSSVGDMLEKSFSKSKGKSDIIRGKK